MEKRILLVDDDEVSHLINSKIIKQSVVDCKIDSAQNGREAFEMLQACLVESVNTYDLIFVDIHMPIMDGFEFVAEFKKMPFPNKEKIKLVILTSSENSIDKSRVAELGVRHYLVKPLSLTDVDRVI
jgi:CheY-like chemotaxis protein